MSRLLVRAPENNQAVEQATIPTIRHHILLEVTTRPIGTSEYDKSHIEIQAAALKEFRKAGKDLFDQNETRKVESAGTTLYQTTETYGTSMSVEKMAEMMNESDLTLRINFKRPGVHSSSTCMELSAKTLITLMKKTPDAHGHKLAELRIHAEQTANVPRHGAMYVAISKKGTQHYLSHIDYKVMSSYDAMYHSH